MSAVKTVLKNKQIPHAIQNVIQPIVYGTEVTVTLMSVIKAVCPPHKAMEYAIKLVTPQIAGQTQATVFVLPVVNLAEEMESAINYAIL